MSTFKRRLPDVLVAINLHQPHVFPSFVEIRCQIACHVGGILKGTALPLAGTPADTGDSFQNRFIKCLFGENLPMLTMTRGLESVHVERVNEWFL